MPRYYFDIHAGSLSEWDDNGVEVADADYAIGVAQIMMRVVMADIDRLGRDRHAVIVIRDAAGNEVATLTGTGSARSVSFGAKPLARDVARVFLRPTSIPATNIDL